MQHVTEFVLFQIKIMLIRKTKRSDETTEKKYNNSSGNMGKIVLQRNKKHANFFHIQKLIVKL